MRRRDFACLDDKRVWVTGHASPVGAAIVRRLWRERCEIVLAGGAQLDLLRQDEVENWFRQQKPDVIFLTDQPRQAPDSDAPASVLHHQLMMSINVLAAARASRVATLVNLTTGCVPAPGAARLPGTPVQTSSSAEVLAKLASIRLTQGYVREHGCRFIVMLSSCTYDSTSAAATGPLPPIWARLSEAACRGEREIEIECDVMLPYGLIHADDLADAAVFVAKTYDGQAAVHCRLSGDASLRSTAELMAELAGYRGRIVLRTRLDHRSERPVASIGVRSLGWRPEVPARERLREMHAAWLRQAPAVG